MDYSTIVLLWSVIVVCVICLMKRFQGHWNAQDYKYVENLPGPKGLPFFGNVFDFWCDKETLFNAGFELAHKYKKAYKTWALNTVAINILNPDDTEVVLTSITCIEKSVLYYFLQPWLGTGLLTSGGNKWHTRRKILTPSFHFNILQQFVPIIAEHSQRNVKTFELECSKECTNVIPIVTEFTLLTLLQTTMGLKTNGNMKSVVSYKESILSYGDLFVRRVFSPWLFKDLLFNISPTGFEMKRVVKALHKFTTDVINDRLDRWDDSAITKTENETGTKQRLAMLDLLIGQMKNGEDIAYDGIREEVDTFMFEGHDTTATGISFILLEIANNKFAQDLIVEELQTIFQNSDRLPTYQDVQNMNYLERCIKESLRLHPPVPFISRTASKPINLRDYTIPKDATIMLHIFHLHRNPLYWTDPEKFNPDRFLPENSVGRHPFLFIPFSAGPRNCIGQRFAMIELKIFMSTILRKFILEPIDTPESLQIEADIILRPKHGINIKFSRRKNTG